MKGENIGILHSLSGVGVCEVLVGCYRRCDYDVTRCRKILRSFLCSVLFVSPYVNPPRNVSARMVTRSSCASVGESMDASSVERFKNSAVGSVCLGIELPVFVLVLIECIAGSGVEGVVRVGVFSLVFLIYSSSCLTSFWNSCFCSSGRPSIENSSCEV